MTKTILTLRVEFWKTVAAMLRMVRWLPFAGPLHRAAVLRYGMAALTYCQFIVERYSDE